MDTLTPSQRSERMARVRSRDTKPELAVRRVVRGLGFRYRLSVAELPGRPDLVFRRQKKAIFVHGCFWHRHAGCPNCRLPKSRLDFWRPKLEGNRQRDRRNMRALRALGWLVLVVWECELFDEKKLSRRLKSFLRDDR
ncbi:MAG: very short patch repair endonuclease [Acidobacteriia bacterium]|nr:very short patch repair endonuclease [Terriglobia bacterium]